MAVEIRVEGLLDLEQRAKTAGSVFPAAHARSLVRAIVAGKSQLRKGLTAASGIQQKLITPHLKDGKGRIQIQEDAQGFPAIAYLGVRRFKSGKGIGGLGYRFGTLPSAAFYADMSKRGWKRPQRVFERTTRKRFPLREVRGPTLADLAQRGNLLTTVTARMEAVYLQRMEHELDRVLTPRA